MKFAVAVVLLAVAFGAEASAIWGAWGHGAYAPALGASGTFDGRSWNSQWDDGHDNWAAARGAWNDGQWNDGQWNEGAWGDHGAWAGRAAWAGPTVVATHGATVIPGATTLVAGGPAVIAAGPAVIPATHATWGHEGSYVAKTRGAVHVAPLSGHANSAASINLQPAPGTI